MSEPSAAADSPAVRRLSEARERILEQLNHVIVGQKQVIEELLICLLARGHCLLEGVPGLAKTLLISTLARTLNCSFSRIQLLSRDLAVLHNRTTSLKAWHRHAFELQLTECI